MLHGALAELHNADPNQRAHTAEVVSRLFLRGNLPGSERGPREPS
jgi:glutamyl-tRNA reductase